MSYALISTSPEKTAYEKIVNEPRRLMNKLRQSLVIVSLGSEDSYLSCFKRIKAFLNDKKLGSLRKLNKNKAISFLKKYRYIFKRPTLKKYRQALQHILRYYGRLGFEEMLPIIKSRVPHQEKSRAYSKEEMLSVCEKMTERNALAVKICYYAGLRAHELLEICREGERTPHNRPALETKFMGLDGKCYIVTGKGGLIRRVFLPKDLAGELEKYRLAKPKKVKDRKIIYYSHYDIGAGKNLSSAFSAASKRAHGWSRGLHGLRHSYAQNRVQMLRELIGDIDLVKETVSQELGHFRKEITETYLR
jgi:integrase